MTPRHPVTSSHVSGAHDSIHPHTDTKHTQQVKIEFESEGKTTVMKEGLKLQEGEVLDSSCMSISHLIPLVLAHTTHLHAHA